jgi:hypothetical protein
LSASALLLISVMTLAFNWPLASVTALKASRSLSV